MKIEYYDSAETCPFKRYQKFNKFLALDGEVGSTPQDIFKRIDRALGYNKGGDQDGVIRELSNLKMTMTNIINEYTPKGTALALMVKSIDGVACTDISTEGLEAVIQRLSDGGMSFEEVENKTVEIKKKSRKSLRYILKSVLVRIKQRLISR